MHLVSVIIPTYNRAQLIGRAIQSVLNQTYKNFELLIIDDGSDDNTEDVINAFADARIFLFKHEKKCGANVARNTGVKIAKGEYLAFLDSDDEWLPTFLESVLDKFQNDKTLGAVYTRAGYITPTGQFKESYRFNIEGFVYSEALAQGYLSHMITIVIKKRSIDLLGDAPFDPSFSVCDDDDFCFRVTKCNKIGLIAEPLAIIHNDGGFERLTGNRIAYAQGWLKLIRKYENDIIRECGNRTLSYHYLTGAKYFLNAGQTEGARQCALRSDQLNRSIFSILYVAITAIPDIILLSLWAGLHHSWNSLKTFLRIIMI